MHDLHHPTSARPRSSLRPRPSPGRASSPGRALPSPYLLALALIACGPGSTGQGGPERAEAADGARRIASQTILSDEVLWSLGDAAQRRVVAVSPLVDDPRYSTVAQTWPTLIPRLPGDSEGLLALDPDLVIIASFTSAETRAFLEAQGVSVLRLEGFSGFDDLWRHTRTIAAASGASEAGERLIEAQRAELMALDLRIGDGHRPAAVSWSQGFVAGADTTFDDIARHAGLTNLAGEKGLSGHVALSVEELVAWDPPVIVIGCEPPRCPEAEAEFAARPGIEATRAAREGRVIALPGAYLSSTGAGMISAARLLGDEQRRRAPEG